MVEEWFRRFFSQREVLKELRKTVVNGKKSFVVNFESLVEHRFQMAQDLLQQPKAFLNQADEVLQDITKLPGMRLRVRGLERSLDKVRAEHLGKFIQVEGVVSMSGGAKLKWHVGRGEYIDYQRIRVGDIDVELEDELAGLVDVGDNLRITGILKVDTAEEPTCTIFGKKLVANHIEVKKQP